MEYRASSLTLNIASDFWGVTCHAPWELLAMANEMCPLRQIEELLARLSVWANHVLPSASFNAILFVGVSGFGQNGAGA